MANVVYTVVKGDTLSEIAVAKSTTVSELLSLNPDIKNKDLIYVGQKIIISGDSPAKKTTNYTQKAKITAFGWQSGQDANGTTVFATWAWDVKNTDHYEVRWKYATGDGVGFKGDYSDVSECQSIYSAPNNATHVSFQVRPISKTYKKGDKDVHYWTAGWSTVQKYYFKNNPPGDTGVPTISGTGTYTLTAKLTNLDINATAVQFQVYNVTDSKVYKTGTANIKAKDATYSCSIKAGVEYKVRSRGVRGNVYGQWSNYSDVIDGPEVKLGDITSLVALSSTSVELRWEYNSKHKIFDIAYTTTKDWFDSNPSGVKTLTLGSTETPHKVGRAVIPDLTAGNEYFFRVRGRSTDTISSSLTWSNIASITIGIAPTAPTTWSSASTVNTGDRLTFNWTHNSIDGSRMTEAKLHLTVNGDKTIYRLVSGTCSTESDVTEKAATVSGFDASDLEIGATVRVLMTYMNTLEAPTLNVNGIGAHSIDAGDSGSCYWDANALVIFTFDGSHWVIMNNNASKTSDSYTIVANYEEDTIIKWEVETAGVLTDSSGDYIYSPLSLTRTVNVYTPPSLDLTVEGLTTIEETIIDPSTGAGSTIETNQLQAFPISITISEDSSNQNPIGYFITVTSSSAYETVDTVGNPKQINSGDEIYSKYFDSYENPFTLTLSPADLDLENGIEYTLGVTASMDSGLTAENSVTFEVAWTDAEFWPNAEIIYDKNTYTTSICPYCADETGALINGVTLSVYRREFDGTFTELASGLKNEESTFVTDPHPALDSARYRVVAITDATGLVTYYDVPGYPIEENAAIIQWDEKWSNFDKQMLTSSDGSEYSDDEEQPAWSGSLVRLVYNLDVSDDYDNDVEHVGYIGRDYPVSYYGTQKNHTQTWNTDIPKTDKDTLYALRRLAAWMGNVYVREPSGSGYWATVKVSFGQTHNELVIPITINITRVEGDA